MQFTKLERPKEADIPRIKNFFLRYASKDGIMTIAELRIVLETMVIHLSEEDTNRLFAQVDADSSGDITFEELYEWYPTFMMLAEESARKMFEPLQRETHFSATELENMYRNYKRISASVVDDGTIDLDEFRQMMDAGSGSGASFLSEALFRVFDADGSGSITFEEFVKLLAIYWNKSRVFKEDKKDEVLFTIFDADSDKRISREDLAKVLYESLASNNVLLDDATIAGMVDATFQRNGCSGAFMSLADYKRERQERGI